MNDTAIIVVNADIPDSIESTLKIQLYIDETITGAEFDARLAADSSYPEQIHISNRRLLIIRPLSDTFNRTAVDFVLRIRNGLVSIETNKSGPPGITYQLDRLTYEKLITPRPIVAPNTSAIDIFGNVTTIRRTENSEAVGETITNDFNPDDFDPNFNIK